MSKRYVRRWMRLLILGLVIFTTNPSIAQPVVTYFPVISTGLSSPVELTNAGDGSERVFIVQQGGTIRVYNSSFVFIKNFLTVSDVSVGGEEGLLSLAFHPDYENPDPAIGGFLYVYYTNTAGDIELARYQVSSADVNTADPLTKVIVMTIPHPGNTNHNGGKLAFGNDGYLYFATGDGGGAGDVPNNAQRGDNLLGKMLRINVTNSATPPYYTIPADNPHVGAGDPLDEIWAIGLRNPFRWSFDRLNYNMWIADVGQNAREEINFRAAGSTGGINYGWRCYEGDLPYNTSGCLPPGNYVFPVYDYVNPDPGLAAVTGGVVYRGSAYPTLQGYYFSTDIYSGDLHIINATTFTSSIQTGFPGGVACFGETENGSVYAVSIAGTVAELQPDQVVPVDLVRFTGSFQRNLVHLTWKTAFEQDLARFEVQYSRNGIQYILAGIVTAANDVNGAEYSYDHTSPYPGRSYYRLKMIEGDGSYKYSSVLPINTGLTNGNFVQPSFIKTGTMSIYLDEPWEWLEIINSNGALLLQKDLGGQTGRINIPFTPLTNGVYIARLRNGIKIVGQKVIVMQ